jgi:hypothetical protein
MTTLQRSGSTRTTAFFNVSATMEGKGMMTRLMHYSYPTIHPQARMAQDPFTLGDALRIYFTILFGVAVCVLAFYYL